jgi:hypothetical protein
MRYPRSHWAISVTVTTRCGRSCAHCTRGVRQVHQADASLRDIEAALVSLRGWRGGVACLGGEPPRHRHFPLVCDMWRRYVPKHRAALFYSSPLYGDRYDYAANTFGVLSYNDHHAGSWHQPIFVGYQDLGLSYEQHVADRERCWLHWHWCPEVKPGIGAYHCEVAATIDMMLTGGKNALPIAPNWWNWPVPERQLALCEMCGVCHNLPAVRDTSKTEYIGRSWADILKPQPGQYTMVRSAADLPTDHTPRHYAEHDGIHYKRRRTWQMFLRQKWFGAGYHLHRLLVWPWLYRGR